MIQFYGHPTCTTCKKAEKWLKENDKAYEWINIKERTPKKEELLDVLESGKLTPKRLFNTSGNLYKEMGLKDKIAQMTAEEMVELLLSDGMLIRRPFLISGSKVSVGFKEETYIEVWG